MHTTQTVNNPPSKKLRNSKSVLAYSGDLWSEAQKKYLMNVTIEKRDHKKVLINPFGWVTEFINCSYFGLDQHPKVVKAFQSTPEHWGVHFCCARSRFSMASLTNLEERLSKWLGNYVITFPSVTSAHASVLPLLASGVLIDAANPPKVCMIFDKYAHASMQYLKPVLATEATIVTITHNSMEELESQARLARERGETPVYLADGVYSMGGVCPLGEVDELSRRIGIYLYLDDAHGTSVYGEHGEGYVLAYFKRKLPGHVIANFSLAKGFGCNGGGVVLPTSKMDKMVRSSGQTYSFSGPLDFSIVEAAQASLDLHTPEFLKTQQEKLRANVALFDERMGYLEKFSPIRMVPIGAEKKAIEIGTQLLKKGFFVSVVFFPVVPKNQAQLRICISSEHSHEDIMHLTEAIFYCLR